MAGLCARRLSTTGLRPSTVWGPSGSSRRVGERRGAERSSVAGRRGADAEADPPSPRYDLWFGRFSAGGVGPRPSRLLRPLPPEPLVGPFFEPGLRRGPGGGGGAGPGVWGPPFGGRRGAAGGALAGRRAPG